MRAALTVTVDGIADMMRTMPRLAAAASDDRAKAVYKELGDHLVARMRARAPYGKRRKAGIHLRDAIFCGVGSRDYPDVLVGVNAKKAPHGHLVEYGTRKMQARPYFWPTVAIERGYITERVRAYLDARIEEIWRA